MEENGVLGTYYISLGLMGQTSATGLMFTDEDLSAAVQRGHELGCHTYDHYPACETPAKKFEDSIVRNRDALRRLLPEAEFKTLSYPISSPRPATKKRSARYFPACRAGGQRHNHKVADLSLLAGFFLEQSRSDPDAIYRLIDRNVLENGWLIFASHDIESSPTRFGCEPGFFRKVVERSVASGAMVLPVAEGLELIHGANA